MPAINFPANPSTNDTYTLSNKTWKFNGDAWELVPLTAGYTGSQGNIGYTGSRGTTGYTGSSGNPGTIGYTGSQGANGDVGAIGYTGSKGDQGNLGYTGSQGYTGSKGDQGNLGYTGSQGYTGSIGYTGSAGPMVGSANQIIYKDSNNNPTGSSGMVYDGTSLRVSSGNVESAYSNGDEGGEFRLAKSATNNTLAGDISIDMYQNKLRIFENGGSTRGAYIDITAMGAGISTQLGTVGEATTSTAASGPGYMGLPQNSKSSAYTLVIGDAGKHIYVTSTATITIPANSSVAYPIGTVINLIAGSGVTITVAITTDTLYLGGSGTTGSRTVAAFGMATLVKLTSTTWIIGGTGVT